MEELLKDSRDEEEVQFIGQGDGKAGRAKPRAGSRARNEGEQFSALVQKQGEEATRRNLQKQREPGTERGPRPGYSFRQEQGTDQGARAVPPGPAPAPRQVPPNNPGEGRGEAFDGFVGN